MLETPAEAAEAPASPPPSDLALMLQRVRDNLGANITDPNVPLAQLSLRRRAHAVVSLFHSILSHQPVGAVGLDFVAAATWLSGYYDRCAAELKAQPTGLITVPGDQLAQRRQEMQSHVVDALTSTANMWRCIVDAAGGVDSSDEATQAGIMRIWTLMTASLVGIVTTEPPRDRQTAVFLTQVMAATAKEAAVMAALLGAVEEQEGEEPAHA